MPTTNGVLIPAFGTGTVTAKVTIPKATLSASGNLSAVVVYKGTVTASGASSATATYNIILAVAYAGYASLSGGSSVSGTFLIVYAGAAYMNTVLILYTQPPVIVYSNSAANLSGSGILTAHPRTRSTKTLSGTGTLAALPHQRYSPKSKLTGTSSTTIGRITYAKATLRGRSPVTSTNLFIFTSKSTLKGKATSAAKPLFVIITSKPTAWNTLTKVTKSLPVAWNTPGRIITSKAFTWKIGVAPKARLQGSGTTIASVSARAYLSGRGRLDTHNNIIAAMKLASWNTLTKVAATQITRYNTHGKVISQQLTSWHTLYHIDPGVKLAWNVYVVTITNTHAKLTGAGTFKSIVIPIVPAKLKATGSLSGTVTRVILASKALAWNDRAKVTANQAMAFNDYGHVKSHIKFSWDTPLIAANLSGVSHIKTIGPVSASKSIHWNARAKVLASLGYSWNTLYEIKTRQAFSWAEQGRILVPRRFNWITPLPIQSQIPFKWFIDQPDIVYPATGFTPTTVTASALIQGMSGIAGLIVAAAKLTISGQSTLMPVGTSQTTSGPTPNTGTTAAIDSVPQASNFTFTVPVGVLVNDVMIIIVSCVTYTSSAPAFAIPASGGGAWTQISTMSDSGPSGGIDVYGTAWYRIATVADPGSAFTMHFTGTQGIINSFYWAAALESYSNTQAVNPIDVTPVPNGTVGSSANFPTAITGDNNDWAIYLTAFTGNLPSNPAGATPRQSIRAVSSNGAVLWDSNMSVGPAGSSIGGQTITVGGSNWWGLFTIGLAPSFVTISGPSYASTVTTDSTGTGNWINTGNVIGTPDGNTASWVIA